MFDIFTDLGHLDLGENDNFLNKKYFINIDIHLLRLGDVVIVRKYPRLR